MSRVVSIPEKVAIDKKSVKNKFRADWLDEEDGNGDRISTWVQLICKPGTVRCVPCNCEVVYGSSGKRNFSKHAAKKEHKKARNSVKITQTLPGCDSKGASICVTDRVIDQKVVVSAFIAEHSLPYKISTPLIELCKKMAQDKTALSKLSMSNTCASYTTTHGLGKAFKDELATELQNKHFSLNIDEATNNAWDKVMNIMVRFYSEEQGRVVEEHLASRKANIATAQILFNELDEVLAENKLPWHNVISILMDNCSTMRGKKNGVETLCREANANLLDISGDTVHMASTAAKAFCAPFSSYVESAAGKMYYDIEHSPKAMDIFVQLQHCLEMESMSLIRPITSRFLQMLPVCERLSSLWDALWIFYYSYLDKDRQRALRGQLLTIVEAHVSQDKKDDAAATIKTIQEKLTKEFKSLSPINKERKCNIVDTLFHHGRKFAVHIHLYIGILPVFQSFVKKFQSSAPLIHILHTRMLSLICEFLALFIKPADVPDTAKEVMALDLGNLEMQLRDKNLTVGASCYGILQKARLDKEPWVAEFYKNLRAGYNKAALSLRKMPLANGTIRALSAVDPEMRKHVGSIPAFETLGKMLPNVLTEGMAGELHMEVRRYGVDNDLNRLQEEYEASTEKRVDVDWWAKVFNLKTKWQLRYPVLTRLVSAILSIFSGPMVEGSFNIMDDIIEKDRSVLKIESYEAMSRIKYHLKRKQATSLTLKPTPKLRKTMLKSYQTYKQDIQKKKDLAIERKSAKSQDQEKQAKIERANKRIKALRKEKIVQLVKSRQDKNNNKRDQSLPDSTSTQKPTKSRLDKTKTYTMTTPEERSLKRKLPTLYKTTPALNSFKIPRIINKEKSSALDSFTPSIVQVGPFTSVC